MKSVLKKHALSVAVAGVCALASSGAEAAGSIEWAAFSQITRASLSAPQMDTVGVTESVAANRDIFVVQLEEPALPLYTGGLPGLSAPGRSANGRLDVRSASSRAYVAHLQTVQQNTVASISAALGRQVEPIMSFQHAINAVVMRLSPREAESVKGLPGVKMLEAYREDPLNTDQGPSLIGAPAVWFPASPNDVMTSSGFEDGETPPAQPAPGNLGEGMVMGDVDSGINFDSPAFAGTDDSGYTHVNPLGVGNYLGTCATGGVDVGLCNDKVIGAYDFVCGPPANVCGQPNILDEPSVEDSNGHGSHTASTVVGNRRAVVFRGNTVNVSGVAPHASIIAYDACYTNTATGQGLCPNVSTLASINQAIADGIVDAINYSIGGGVFPWIDSRSQAFLAAHEAGIFVAASAGNSGPAASTLGHVEPWVTTSAASTHTRAGFDFQISATGPGTPPANVVGLGVNLGTAGSDFTASIPPTTPLIVSPDYIANAAVANDGCAAYPAGTFTGGIAVIRRGTCGFSIKATNALNAGAVAVVIANNVAAGIIPAGTPPIPNIPVFGATDAQGLALRQFDIDTTGSTAQIPFPAVIVAGQPDVVAAFSSRGPALIDVLKPDIASPGVNILATLNGASTSVGLLSGTSMASPHTAGSGMLIKKAKPSWTPSEIKSALMTTAITQGVVKEDGVTAATPFDRGAGRTRVDRAIQAGLVVADTGLNYSNADPFKNGDPSRLNLPSMQSDNCGQTSCTFTRKVRSTLSEPETWSVALTSLDGTVSPTSFTIAPGDTQVININVNTPSNAAQFHFGEVTLTPTGTSPALHLPVVVRMAPPELSLSPAAIVGSVAANTTATTNLTVSNVGGDNLVYSTTVSGTQTVPLLIQPSQENNGFTTSFFAGQSPAPAGAYVADDFVTLAPTTLRRISAPGFLNSSAASLAAAGSNGVTFKVYTNLGVPAGNPEGGATGEVYSCTRGLTGPTATGLTVTGASGLFQVTLDTVAAATSGCPAAPALANGTYWSSVIVNFTGTSAAGRWAQFVTPSPLNNTAQLISPTGLLGYSTTWAAISATSTFEGFALNIAADVDCTLPAWLSAPTPGGALGGGGSTSIPFTINTTGLTPGVYRANYCVLSNDADEAAVTVPVVITVP